MINVYINRDNSVAFLLSKDQQAVSVGVITRAVLQINEKWCLDTNEVEDPIELEERQITINGSTEDTAAVVVKFGKIDGITPGNYTARITIFDALATDGIAWGLPIKLKAIQWYACDAP